jgi:hypothetical protein
VALPQWLAVSRTSSYQLAVTMPILSLSAVLRHLGVGTAVLTTHYTPERWASLAPANGVQLYRNGAVQLSGLVSARQLDWSRESAEPVIKVEVVDDLVHLADRLCFPDPLRAADDQSVNDYWMPRSGGVAASVQASTAMRTLISEQAGPACAASRQVSGLVLGADPGAGVTRTWSALFTPVLEQLTTMSVASGANLGVRMVTGSGSLTASIVVPSNTGMKFSADLSNLVGFSYREEAPTITHALSAGQGDLHLRQRHLEVTTDAPSLTWGRQIWSYIDRRDTSDATELTQADTDALAGGVQKVSLTCQLTDSDAATYGTDWQLGSIVTVYVGLPDQTRVATITDVVREVSISVDESGAESLEPAIGTYDAKSLIPTPTQVQIARIGAALGSLIARK